MYRPRRLARPARIAALACLSLTGCAWSQPPQPRDALIAPSEIKRPLSSTPQGQLMMLPEGDWALVHDTRSGDEPQALPQGAIVITSRGEGAQANVYGVRLQRSWGVVLQRLDARRVAPGTTQQLAALATDSRTLVNHGVCAGDGDPRANDCLQAAPTGTRFSLFALDAQGALAGLSDARQGYLLGHTPRIALAQRGFDDVTLHHEGATPSRWIAIAHPHPRPRTARAAVALDPACPALSAPPSAQLRVVRAPVAAADNPVTIEQLTLRLGVDAAMRCDGDEVVAMTPTWWRAPLRDPWTGQSQGPGALGMMPLRAHGLSDAQRGLLAAAQAAHATGDVELAAFWLERLLARLASSSRHDALALQSAQALALGGRPELALHVATAATRARWNRAQDLLYNLTGEAVYRGLGLERESLKMQGKAAALAAADPRLVSSGWYVWQQALRQGVKRVFSSPSRQTEQTAARSDPDAKLWVLSLFDEWLMPPHQPDEHFSAMEREALRERHQALDLLTLWEALTAPPAPLTDATTSATLDSYGRGLSALAEDARWEAIAQVATLRVQPSWLDALAKSDDPLWRAALVMTSSSLELDEGSISALGEAMGGAGCERAQALSRIAHDALLRRRAIAPGAFADAQEGALWVMEHGLTRACQDMDTLWAAVEALPPRARALVAPHAAALFEGWLRGGAGATQQRVALLERAMRASSAGPRCATWGLALALAALRDGELERARAGATRALNCGGEDAAARRPDGELLLAMIGYEMSGQYVGAGSDEALAARLRAAAKPDPALAWCPGLQDDRPALKRAMPKTLWRLASSLSSSSEVDDATDAALTQPARPRDGNDLMGSSAVIALAMEDLAQARHALERGDIPATSATLERARAALAQAGHHAEARRADAILRGLFARDEQTLNGPLIAPAPWAAQLAKPGGAAAAQAALLTRPKLSPQEAALLTSLTLLRSAPDAWRSLRERQDVAPAWEAICD